MKPALKQQSKSVAPPPPLSFAQMKKTILAQMAQVQEDDLNVMSVEEITVFYHELLASQGQAVRHGQNENGTRDENRNEQLVDEMFQAEEMGQGQGDDQSRLVEEKKQQCNYEFDSPSNLTYNQNPSKPQTFSKLSQPAPTIKINNSQYFKPQSPSHPLYTSTNNRYRILLNPHHKTPQQRRQAVLLAKHPKMSKQIRKMTNKEIKQVYDMMRVPDQKEQYVLGKNKASKLETVEFCVYVTKCEVESTVRLKGEVQTIVKQKKQKDSDRPKEKNHKVEEEKKIKGRKIIDYAQQDFQYQRVNRSSRKKQKLNLKNDRKDIPQKDLMQQQYQQHKCVQQPKKPPKVPRITITTYTEQQYQQQSSMQSPMRARPEQFLAAMQQPRKINPSQLQQALINPNHVSRPVALEWIRNLKGVVTQLENYYLRYGEEGQGDEGQGDEVACEKDGHAQPKDEQNIGEIRKFRQQAASTWIVNDQHQKEEI